MTKRSAPPLLSPHKRPHYEVSEDESSELDVPVENTSLWKQTIHRVIQSVVLIQFSNVTSFDTESSCVSEATGFVVDSTRGIILTNRHVVGPGPFTGYAVFDNHEEAVVKPIYRDPIHDFGFLKFDPSEVKHMKIDQLELRPDLAKVGTEIRVVGNDNGEKLTILAGFISRVDRHAPDYGTMTYNDFNTEYIQAAASASGGSSGSPVVDENGYAVALQAGGATEASTDFFLPVSRPLRTLKCIQAGEAITRGDIQVEWVLKPFEECRRLGLTPEAEAAARQLFPEKSGLLVAELILPEGPADGKVQEGDTLISIQDIPVSASVAVDEILDAHVGDTLKFVLHRGGVEVEEYITIGNIHDITPDRYVEVAGALFNNLSYQIARSFCLPVKGVYANSLSASFELSTSSLDQFGWIIETVDDQAVANLDEFVAAMKNVPDRLHVTVTFRHVTDMNTEYCSSVAIGRRWQPSMELAIRNDVVGTWDFTTLQEKPLPPAKRDPHDARFIDIPFDSTEYAGCSQLLRSLVEVSMVSAMPVDGYPYQNQTGHGVVVDASQGYVLVSRWLVPHDVCDVSVVIADSINVPAEVVFLHPNQNYAIIKYDPSLVLADVRTPVFSTERLKRGDRALFVGHNYSMRLVTEEVKISATQMWNIPACTNRPRYRGTNLDVIVLDSKISQDCDLGVLADAHGHVRGLWLTFLGEPNCDSQTFRHYRMGLDVNDVADVVSYLKQHQKPPALRILDCVLSSVTVLEARNRGVPSSWISKYEHVAEDHVKLLAVSRVPKPKKDQAPNPLRVGDIVLEVNGQLVLHMRDINANTTTLKFTVLRQKKIVELEVPTIDTSSINTSHIVSWCGALIQAPHHNIRQLMDAVPSEVYVTHKSASGPANQYGLTSNAFITHINDKVIHDLDDLTAVIRQTPDESYVKIRVVSFDNVPMAISLKTNYHFFPTSILKREAKWESHSFNRT